MEHLLMDSRDLLILGGVAVAGYFGWRWWKARTITNASQNAAGTEAGNAATSMTETGARTTVFGPAFGVKRLFLPPVQPPIAPTVAPTAPAAASPDLVTDSKLRAFVLQANLGNLPVAPSPSNVKFTGPAGIRAGVGTGTPADPAQPGDPGPTFFALRGIG
jgi:hypothetical protein